jgi:hypothetical protein
MNFNVVSKVFKTPHFQLLVLSQHFVFAFELDQEWASPWNHEHLVWPTARFQFDALDPQFHLRSFRRVAFSF